MYSTILLQVSRGADLSSMIMIVLIIVIFYFFMIRPQNKRRKKIEEERNRLEKGAKVITSGGIYGKIKEVRDTTFVVEIAEGVKITVDRNCIYAASDSDAVVQQAQMK